MFQFHIQSDSDIPASRQLLDQIQFAIASRQYPPGHRLPSTRQLAMITGLHRNTVSKVYQQLEERGLVASIAGSGIYVKPQGHEGGTHLSSPLLQKYPQASQQIKQSLDDLLATGLTLSQARELLLAEIDWRLRCNAQVLVTVPASDLGAGELIAKELEQALGIAIELVPLEELAGVLAQTHSATVIASRYFIGEAEAIAKRHGVRAIPVDIYDYSQELERIKRLPQDSRLGIVSLSTGILQAAEILIHSLRGDQLLVMTAQVSDRKRLEVLVRTSQTIVSDRASYSSVKRAISAVKDDLIRHPELICSENYIGTQSVNLLKRELGLGM